MKLLILGASGMLGHQLWRHFAPHHETWVSLRRPAADFAVHGLFQASRTCVLPDASDRPALARLLQDVRPDVVLNCVGIIKQVKAATSPIPSLCINALLPHHLAELCDMMGARLVLFSTDCVFSGRKGNYSESDLPDPEDLYGRTKLLGEVANQPHVITLRSSIIGRELGTAHSLVDWFLAQRGRTVRGYRRAIYSGFTTMEMARVVGHVILHCAELSGIWHVASAPLTKYELLHLLRESYQVPVEIQPFDDFVCDRSLNGSRFAAATGYVAPAWGAMVQEMAANPV